MSDSLPNLDDLKTLMREVGRLEATTEVLAGITQMANEYSASHRVNSALLESDPEARRVADSFWEGYRLAINEVLKVVNSIPNYTDNSEKS